MSILIDQLRRFVEPAFIETGTYTGLTIQKALDVGFEEIHSVEISPHWHAEAKKRYAAVPSVNLYLGNSADVLRDILPLMRVPYVLWLDAHNFEFCPENIEHGNASPLLDELEAVSESPIGARTILIDDLPSFGFLGYDLDSVKDALLQIQSCYAFDILQNEFKEDQILVARMTS